MFEVFEILKDLERQRVEIVQIERTMCEPLLSDVKYIAKIYELVRARQCDKTEEKQLFIILVLLFYSPKKLVVGTKINKRIMNAMCRVTGYSQPLLSTYSRNLIFYYHHYTHFREEVDFLMLEIRKMLIDEGIPSDKIEDYLYKFSTRDER